mmetsp:Transcript_26013/g.56407  ORF Transcript_26013/g.56407 Transcript_26013/m.56407 type:complete len:240 (-) Transcript_26013:2566-3285(-)
MARPACTRSVLTSSATNWMRRSDSSWLTICPTRPKPAMMMWPRRSSTSAPVTCSACMSCLVNCFAIIWPTTARYGVTAIDSATTSVSCAASFLVMMPSITASPKVTNANSPPGARNIPARNAVSTGSPKSGPMAQRMATLEAIRPTSMTAISVKPSKSSLGSMLMPTVMKNSPSSSPRKGAMSDSTCRWNSVSANSSPARKAPSAEESPRLSVSNEVPSTTRRVVALKISALSVRAMAR